MKEAPIIPLLKFETSGLSFKIETIRGLKEEQQDSNEYPHKQNYYEIIWIARGAGTIHADLQKLIVESNMVYCVKPGEVHLLQTSEDTEGFVISFTDTFINMNEHEFDWKCLANLFHLFSSNRPIQIGTELATEMKEIIAKMQKELDNLYPCCGMHLVKRYFKIFLIYLIRQFEQNPQETRQTRETELVQSFMDLLEKNFKEKKMVFEYAAQLSVTPNYLNGIIKKNTGFSAGHHIRQRVVLEAKRLGWYSDAGMKEIAYSLGFSDSGHFSKFFKAVSGMNFSEFKKQSLTSPMFSQQSLTA